MSPCGCEGAAVFPDAGRRAYLVGVAPGCWAAVPRSVFPGLTNRRISPISPAPVAILEWRGAELTFTLQRLPTPPATTAADPPARPGWVSLEPHVIRMGVIEIGRGAPEQNFSGTLPIQDRYRCR